jgi:hypothetical protein
MIESSKSCCWLKKQLANVAFIGMKPMKLPIDQLEYQKLELIIPPNSPRPVSQLIAKALKTAWQWLTQSLFASQEVKVWCTADPQGNLSWSALDPISGRSVNGLSEDQMRVWLEQRHLNK